MGVSLLDRGNTTILLYPEEEWTDTDGNTMTRPAATPIPVRAMIQPRSSSETDARGFEVDTEYRMRLVRGAPVVGPQARIEWAGQYWAISGEPLHYNTSRRTAHTDYTIRRT